MTATSTFVGSTVAMVSVRPTSVAHVVRANDRDGLQRAVAYACTEWGGAGQPIFQLVRGLRSYPRWDQLRGIVRPEAIIEFAGLSREEADRLASVWQTRVFLEGQLSHPGLEPGAHAGVVLDSAQIRARTLFVPRRRASLAETVALGTLAQDQLDHWRSLGLSIVERETNLELLEAQLDKFSPVSITRQVFRAYESESFYAPIFLDVSTRPSIASRIHFWNMRAAGVANGLPVIWLPPAALRDQGIVSRLREAMFARDVQAQPDLVIDGDRQEDLDALAAGLGLVPLPPGPHSVRLIGDTTRDIAMRPLTYRKRLDPAQWLFGRRLVGTVRHVPTTVTEPVTTVTFDTPVPFFRSNGPVKVAVKDANFEWPPTPATARLIHDDAWWSAHGLTLGFHASRTFQFGLRVPGPVVVAGALLGERGWTWKLSDKGRYAQAMVDSMPGVNLPVSSENELLMLRALVSRSRRKAEQAIRAALGPAVDAEALAATAAGILPTLVPRWRSAQELASELRIRRPRAVLLLNGLIDRHMVRRAVRFQCPRCGLEENVALQRADDQVRCDGCRMVSTMRGEADSEPVLTYGLSSLVDRVLDQDCLGHVLVQRWLERERAVLWSVPGAEVVSAAAQREVDVLGVSRKALVVAEVKNRTTGFSDAEVTSTAELARDLGAGVLVLATLDGFEAARREAVRATASSFSGETILLGLADLVGQH